MSHAWHCDNDSCDAWTRAGYSHGFIVVSLSQDDLLHFCSWDCLPMFGSGKEPLITIGHR
jgi:hypothetical protein